MLTYITTGNNPIAIHILSFFFACFKAIIPKIILLKIEERIRMFTSEESCAATKVYGELIEHRFNV